MTEINKDLAASILAMFNKVKTFNDMTPTEAIMFNKAVIELSKIAFPDGVDNNEANSDNDVKNEQALRKEKKRLIAKPKENAKARRAVKKRATKKAAQKRSVPVVERIT